MTMWITMAMIVLMMRVWACLCVCVCVKKGRLGIIHKSNKHPNFVEPTAEIAMLFIFIFFSSVISFLLLLLLGSTRRQTVLYVAIVDLTSSMSSSSLSPAPPSFLFCRFRLTFFLSFSFQFLKCHRGEPKFCCFRIRKFTNTQDWWLFVCNIFVVLLALRCEHEAGTVWPIPFGVVYTFVLIGRSKKKYR